MKKKEKSGGAVLRKAWNAWMTDQIKKGAKEDEAVTTGNLLALCNAFELRPDEFGLIAIPNGRFMVTYKTSRILAQLLMSTIARLLELSPNPDSVPTD